MKLKRRRGPLTKGAGHLQEVMASPSGAVTGDAGDAGGITAGRDRKKTAVLDVVSMKQLDTF